MEHLGSPISEVDRDFDIVIYGASGVTGKVVVEQIILRFPGVKWAVAGRNDNSIHRGLLEVYDVVGDRLDYEVQIIIADVSNFGSLLQMCMRTKVLLNCVGPYRFYGEEVVRACIDAGTHYVDVCGEPEVLETLQLKYFAEAQERELFVVGACGFDSMPCDLGVEYLRQNMTSSCDGEVNSVETYLGFKYQKGCKINYATWQSAIHGLANASQLKEIRQDIKREIFPTHLPIIDFPLEKRPSLFKNESGSWCVPFVGSDKSVVRRTQYYKNHYEKKRPIQVETYLQVPSYFYGILVLVFGFIFKFLAKGVLGRFLLETFPAVFSCGLVTAKPLTRSEALDGEFTMTLVGTGWDDVNCDNKVPNKKMTVVVHSHRSPYVITALCALTACTIILDESEREHMPAKGGVYTPAAAFARTSLIEKLNKIALTMSVVDVGSVEKV